MPFLWVQGCGQSKAYIQKEGKIKISDYYGGLGEYHNAARIAESAIADCNVPKAVINDTK